MRLLKQIAPLFLSFTLIACCLTFQADISAQYKNITTSSWVSYGLQKESNQNAYQLNLRRAHSIFENNFSIFNLKCCLKHHNNLLAEQYNKQNNIYLPKQIKYFKVFIKSFDSKNDELIS